VSTCIPPNIESTKTRTRLEFVNSPYTDADIATLQYANLGQLNGKVSFCVFLQPLLTDLQQALMLFRKKLQPCKEGGILGLGQAEQYCALSKPVH
jgi:hypothetical protein